MGPVPHLVWLVEGNHLREGHFDILFSEESINRVSNVIRLEEACLRV